MNDSLISKIQVKKFLRKNGVRISKNLYSNLDEAVKELLLKAVKRVKQNRRDTIIGWDL